MSRLPTPGSDDGNWGEILNDFLEQSHNSDGSLKSSAIPTIAASDVITSDSSTVQAKITDHASQLAAKMNKSDPLAAIRHPRPMMTFMDDDGALTFLTKWLPIIQSKNIKMSCAVVSDWIGTGTFMGWNDLADISDAGVEIICHSKVHDVDIHKNGTIDEVEAMFREAQGVLQAHGYPANYLAYVASSGDDQDVRTAATRVFDAAFFAGGKKPMTPPLSQYQMYRYPFDTATTPTLEYFKSVVDDAVAKNGWVIWMSHSQNATLDATVLGYAEDLIDYCAQQGVDIVTVKEGMESMGNALTVGKYGVGADGSFVGNGVGVGISAGAPIPLFFTPGTEYLLDTVTHEMVGTADYGMLFPNASISGGILATYRRGEYVHQLFMPNGISGEVWHRFYLISETPGIFLPLHTPAVATSALTANGVVTKVGAIVYDTTRNKPLWVKTAGEIPVYKVEFTAGATTSGNIQVGTATFAVEAGDTAADVAQKYVDSGYVAAVYRQRLPGTAIVYWARLITSTPPAVTFTDTDDTGVTATVTTIKAGSAPVLVDATGEVV